MQNQFKLKTVGVLVVLVYTLGTFFINFTFALICFDCEGVTCDVGPIYLKKCQSETSVCILFKDVTGRALRKGNGHVWRRTCGVAVWPNNATELKCMKYTANFDKCICRADLCNGDDSLLELTTTTVVYPPSTTDNGEGGSGEDGSTTPGPGGNITTPGPGGNVTTPGPGGNVTTPRPGGNVTTPGPITTPRPGGNVTTPRPGGNVTTPGPITTPRPGGNVTTPRPGPGPVTKPPGPGGGGGKPDKPTTKPGGKPPQEGRSMIQGRAMGGPTEETIRTKCEKSKSKRNQAVLKQEEIPGSGE